MKFPCAAARSHAVLSRQATTGDVADQFRPTNATRCIARIEGAGRGVTVTFSDLDKYSTLLSQRHNLHLFTTNRQSSSTSEHNDTTQPSIMTSVNNQNTDQQAQEQLVIQQGNALPQPSRIPALKKLRFTLLETAHRLVNVPSAPLATLTARPVRTSTATTRSPIRLSCPTSPHASAPRLDRLEYNCTARNHQKQMTETPRWGVVRLMHSYNARSAGKPGQRRVKPSCKTVNNQARLHACMCARPILQPPHSQPLPSCTRCAAPLRHTQADTRSPAALTHRAPRPARTA